MELGVSILFDDNVGRSRRINIESALLQINQGGGAHKCQLKRFGD